MLKKMQLTLYNYLEKPELSKTGLFLSKVLLTNLLINLLVVLLLTFFSLDSSTRDGLESINTINIYIFIIELLARFYVVGVNEEFRGFSGRLKFLVKPYTIIDIVSIAPHFITGMNPYLVFILRSLRAVKLLRFKNFFHKLFNFEMFVTSNLGIQFIILLVVSTITIFIFRFFYTEPSISFDIFMDPSSLNGTRDVEELSIGILESILGLIVGGTLISIITETLANKTEEVKNGFIKIKDKEHIIIINQNPKLDFILDELDNYYSMIQYLKTVVILLPNSDNIDYFIHNLKNYKGISVKVVTGELYSWQTFERIGVNNSSKIILLEDDNVEKHQNIKIVKFLTSNVNFINKNINVTVDTKYNFVDLYNYCFSIKSIDYQIVIHKDIIEMFLNRSVINIDYFRIFEEFLSFGGCNFYVIDSNRVLNNRDISFGDIYNSFKNSLIIGVIRDENFIINPDMSFKVQDNDKLIYISNNENDIFLDSDEINTYKTPYSLKLERPKVKTYKKIAILGDFGDFSAEHINEFLTDDSIRDINYIVKDEYMDDKLWDEIEKDNYDLIIFNLEDEYEFLLSLYIKNRYKENPEYFNKIVNILNNSRVSDLLKEEDDSLNIILSDKISAQFITQLNINPYLEKIYDEITHSFGSEFYLLSKDEKYNELFNLSYEDLKSVLIQNNMLYIGVMKNNKFILNRDKIKDADKIVVLTEGLNN